MPLARSLAYLLSFSLRRHSLMRRLRACVTDRPSKYTWTPYCFTKKSLMRLVYQISSVFVRLSPNKTSRQSVAFCWLSSCHADAIQSLTQTHTYVVHTCRNASIDRMIYLLRTARTLFHRPLKGLKFINVARYGKWSCGIVWSLLIIKIKHKIAAFSFFFWWFQR